MSYAPEHQDFAENTARKAEDYYNSIADDLGYARYSNFWKWENRVKIFIFPDHAAYIRASGQAEWSNGMANYTRKEISSFAGSEDFLNTILPHEIAHLVFRDFVGFKGEVPLWLDEGVAQWEEKNNRDQRVVLFRKFVRDKVLLSLQDMMRLDVRTLRDNATIRMRGVTLGGEETTVLFVSDNKLVELYYVQAFSLVMFLTERYGTDSFINFCRKLRNGDSIEKALQGAYPTQIRSLVDLEKLWLEYVRGL